MSDTILKFLKELEELEKKATPGEWNAYDWTEFPRKDEYNGCIRIESETTITAFCFGGKINYDALLISQSRNALPKLLKAMRILLDVCELDKHCSGHGCKEVCSNAIEQVEELLK